MMSFQNSLKSICRPVVINVASHFLLKFFSTDVRAVQKLKFRSPKPNNKFIDLGGYTLLIIPVSAFGLGTWQVFRKFEREKFIEEFRAKINQPPVELPKDLEELKHMEFRAVKVKGKFIHNKELYLGPRTETSDKNYSTLISRDKGGYMVITPFELSDRKLTILVNRGWVPSKKKSPVARKEGQITDEVELVGLVRLHEPREPLGMKNMPEIGYWVYRDLYKMAEVSGAAPVLIDADIASTVPGGPKGGQTLVEIRNVHLSYIYTWYGLGVLSSWLWFKKYLYKRPRSAMHYIPKPYSN